MKLRARATTEQMKHAMRLGISFHPNITQGEIHLLINAKAKKKVPPPTAMQVRIATMLGLDFDKPGMSQHYLGNLIVEALVERFDVDDVIKHEGQIYTIKSLSEVGDTWIVDLRSHETGRVQRRTISTIAFAERMQQ